MIDYEEDWLITVLPHLEGSVAMRASMFAVPAAMFAVGLLYVEEYWPGLREDLGLLDLGGSTIWNAGITVAYLLISFRTGQAFSRFWEGTGLLHMMRGEWFDTVSNCVSFSIAAKKAKPQQVIEFRHALVRLMSLCHGSALEEISGYDIKVPSIDVLGLDMGTLRHLHLCHAEHGFNKVEVMLHLVQSLITCAHDSGVLKIPPPILSRVYQTISRGFVNLLNAKKITDTRFPFPYAQLIAILLTIHLVLTPIVITGSVHSKVMAAVLTFIPIFSMYSLNFVGSELENPFGTDANDLPLDHFQEEMNGCLLMLLHHNTDMYPGVREDCQLDFDNLLVHLKHNAGGATFGPQRLSSWAETHPDDEDDGDPADRLEEEQNQQVDSEVPKPAPPKVEAQPFLTAPPPTPPTSTPQPAGPTAEERLLELHPRLTWNLGRFSQVLHCWTNGFEGEMLQMHETFAALRAVNGVRGWEAAVQPIV